MPFDHAAEEAFHVKSLCQATLQTKEAKVSESCSKAPG